MLFISDTLVIVLTNIFTSCYTANMKKNIHKISSYFAVFDPAEEGGYNVSFPDFPGCVTFGTTFEQAKKKAKEVLELWLEELASAHEEIPTRSVRPLIDEVRITLPARYAVTQ